MEVLIKEVLGQSAQKYTAKLLQNVPYTQNFVIINEKNT